MLSNTTSIFFLSMCWLKLELLKDGSPLIPLCIYWQIKLSCGFFSGIFLSDHQILCLKLMCKIMTCRYLIEIGMMWSGFHLQDQILEGYFQRDARRTHQANKRNIFESSTGQLSSFISKYWWCSLLLQWDEKTWASNSGKNLSFTTVAINAI